MITTISLNFKRVNDHPEHFYILDVSDESCGEFIYYEDNDRHKGTCVTKSIRLKKMWRFDKYSNDMGYVYVTPLVFENEFYPVVLGLDTKGTVETMIDEAARARLEAISPELSPQVEDFFKVKEKLDNEDVEESIQEHASHADSFGISNKTLEPSAKYSEEC